jgi:hypothetical protein
MAQWNPHTYHGTEEISICCISLASQVLLNRSKEMKITGCKMGMAGRVGWGGGGGGGGAHSLPAVVS